MENNKVLSPDKVLSFDIGLRNMAVALIIKDKVSSSIFIKKFDWKNWNKDKTKYLKDLFIIFHLEEFKDLSIIIERQITQKMSNIASFIEGYFTALNYKVKIVTAISYGKKLKTRKERKDYSVQLLENKLDDNLIRDHDLCDSINLGLRELNYPIINKNKIFLLDEKSS